MKIRQVTSDIESISEDLEKICAHLEVIAGALVRAVDLAERIEMIPLRIVRTLLPRKRLL